MGKGSQPGVYVDLPRFQSRVKDPNNTQEEYYFIFHSLFSCSCTCLRKIKNN